MFTAWMVCMASNDTERQYLVQNNSFKMFTPICLQSADLQQYLQPFARCVFTTSLLSAFYNNFYTIHTDTSFPVFLLFLFINNVYRGSGLTFIVTLQFLFVLFFSFKTICQQRELPLLFDAAAVKCGSFLLLLGRGSVTRVTFIVGH